MSRGSVERGSSRRPLRGSSNRRGEPCHIRVCDWARHKHFHRQRRGRHGIIFLGDLQGQGLPARSPGAGA